jgi:hypothetical protein
MATGRCALFVSILGTPARLTDAKFHRQCREGETMPDERELIHSFDRSATEQLQVSLSKYKGKTYADIRIYYKADDGEYRPTKKGITVSPAQLPELGEAIRKLIEKVAGSE